MNKQHIYGLHAVAAVLENTPQKICSLLVQQDRYDHRLKNILALARDNEIKPQLVSKKKLDQLFPNVQHQGVIAMIIADAISNEADLPELLDNLQRPPFLLILDGIQDPHNLGACLRSANAAGVNAVIAPKDNAVGLTAIVRKVACGAVETTPFIQVTNLTRTMRMLKERGIWLYGAAAEAEKNIYEQDLSGAVGIVLGAEEKGLRRLTQENCDGLMKIPMFGSVTSLNVSVATGICLFEAIRQGRGE